MKNVYTPTAGEVVIPVNAHLQRVQYFVVFYYLVIAAVLYWWFGSDPNLASWLTSSTVWVIYVLLFAGTLLLGQINKQKKVVFSSSEQAVYSQSYFGKKTLMTFADIGTIKPYSNGSGMTYFGLFGRENLFQRSPPRISPYYTTAKKSSALYREFEQTVVPELRALVSSQAPQPRTQPSPVATGLTYYQEENGGYELKNTYNRTIVDKAIPIALLAVSAFILLSPSLRLQLFSIGVGIGLAGCIMAFLLTEKKLFQHGQLISGYKWGWLRKTYPVSQFSTYQITHRKYNFVYVGTDVNLVFSINNKPKAIFLCQMRKTKKIESLITETDYIMDTMMQQRVR